MLGLWNMYGRVTAAARVGDATPSWTYGSSSWRAMDGSASNRVAFVQGLAEDPVSASLQVGFVSAAASPAIAIGLDSTNAPAGPVGPPGVAGATATYAGLVGTGLHALQALEASPAGNTIFYGSLYGSQIQALLALVRG